MYRNRNNSYRRGRNNFSRNRSKKRDFIDIEKFISQKSDNSEKKDFISKNKFSDFNISERIKLNLKNKGYINPTQIQDECINPILNTKDVVGLAQTGTGKTAAFLIPLIDKAFRDNNKSIIITPTRELALQINTEFRSISEGMNLYSCICIGGVNIQKQIQRLKNKNDFIIGTPGRLKDLYKRGLLDMNNFNTVVLDEVDTMLDMGFLEDIRFLISKISSHKQSLFFSATLPNKAKEVLKSFVNDPIFVSVDKRDPSENVSQDIIKVNKDQNKIEILHDLLIKDEFKKVLIFIKTKRDTEKLSDTLNKRGFRVQSIHGDKSQYKREKALAQFKENKVQILVATDVASRGLDISDITHVINFDLPSNYEDYIHRIGRTGRGNKMGKALTFIST
jgi:superfamily II DNA/RNA helicase